jgi:hypothetical protein
MNDRPFGIDPDIRTATTLPARVYSDPTLFEFQRGVHHFHRLLGEFMNG